jgi:hypothetical protein
MSVLQIVIITLSLVIFIGRIFFGLFKHLSPFKYKDSGSACAPTDLDLTAEERIDDFSTNSNSPNGPAQTSSPIRVEISQPGVQADGVDDSTGLRDNAVKTNQDEGEQKEGKRRRFKRVNFESVSHF